jgi:Fe-S-cluster containining protein
VDADARDELGDFDCQSCGACCHGDEGWVGLDRADDGRIARTPDLARLVVYVRTGSGVRRSLRFVAGRCEALHLDDGGTVSCRIYDDRPEACRALLAGSPACRAARDDLRERSARPLAEGESAATR